MVSRFSSSSMARHIQHPSTQICSRKLETAERIGIVGGDSVHILVSSLRLKEYRWRVDSASWMLWNLPYWIRSCQDSWILSMPDHTSKVSSDEFANHWCTIFSAPWDASDLDISDDLCHHMSSQTKATV